MSIIQAVADGGFVYHDGFSIRHVSFVPDTEAASKFDQLVIPHAEAGKFVQGEYDPRAWFVWRDTLRTLNSEHIDLEFIDDTFVRLSEGSGHGLIVKVYHEDHRIVLHNNLPLECHHFDELMLTFVLTEHDDPSAVLYALKVPAAALFNNGVFDVTLPIRHTSFDVYTRRLFPNTVIAYPSPEEDVALALPAGHFHDLMKVGRQPVKRGLLLVHDPCERTLSLSVIGRGVEKYQRAASGLRMLFSWPNDPAMLWHTMMVPLDAVQHGVTIDLPSILPERFDIWTQLVFRQAYLVER